MMSACRRSTVFDAVKARIWSSILLTCVLFALASVALAGGPDPRATALIGELGLKPATVASRDQPGWAVPKRVVVANAESDQLQQLQAVAPAVEVVAAAQGAALKEQLAGAQAVIGLCDADTLSAAKALH